MPEIGKLKQVSQGSIHITSVESGTVNPAKVEIASLEWNGATYDGAYEVTPSGQTQTLSTYGRILTDDIVVKPIPSNYGKITWNGSYLTVT